MVESRPGLTMPVIYDSGRFNLGAVSVFADGGLECFGIQTLDAFRAGVAAGKVRASIPDGKSLAVDRLGPLIVTDGRWDLDGEGLIARVEQLWARQEETAWTRGRVDHRQ